MLCQAVAIVALIGAADTRLSHAQVDNSEPLERCKSITDSAARLRCYEDATSSSKQPARPPDASGLGTWRSVRTPNPRGGPDLVSIMQTADLSRSDIGFAGLILRCSDTSFEVLIVLVNPSQPRARPQVKLITQGSTVVFTANVISPGTALALPNEVAALFNGPWQSVPELALEVDDGGNVIRGVVALKGLGPALARLLSSCPR
jgi:hypothetical protein